ncbi:hypothetical protein Salat_2495000 [Sesamum alatum]|uniref:Uncharacterized protein n=1 Tax=Sesamum alatum TaxID=300844 RepID=A0AAE1XRI4_9LAMI|nr:hypothetical protein Salat_2495000 [Sesamum alatum]
MVDLSRLVQSKQIQEKGNKSKLQKEEKGIRAKTPSDVVRGNTIMHKTHFSLIPDDIIQREGTSATRQLDGQDGVPLNSHVYVSSSVYVERKIYHKHKMVEDYLSICRTTDEPQKLLNNSSPENPLRIRII